MSQQQRMLELMFSGAGASGSQPRSLLSVTDLFQQRAQLPLQLTNTPQQPQVTSPSFVHVETPPSSRQLAFAAAVESQESSSPILRKNTDDLAAKPEPVKDGPVVAGTPGEPFDDIQHMLNALSERKRERKADPSTGSQPRAKAAAAAKAEPTVPKKRPAAAVDSDSVAAVPLAGGLVAPNAVGQSKPKAKAKGMPHSAAKAKTMATVSEDVVAPEGSEAEATAKGTSHAAAKAKAIATVDKMSEDKKVAG